MGSVTNRSTTVDCGAVYAATRARFVALMESLAPDGLASVVPATPAWTVRDTLAHVVGIAADLNTGMIETTDPDGWTARQVDTRRGRSVAEIVAEWDREAPAFEDGLRLFGYSVGAHFVGDLHAHVQDVRSALGLPADRDPLTVRVSLDFYLESWGEDVTADGAGSIEVIADDERLTIGTGPAFASLSGDPFEVLRACSGRRSADQIRHLTWTGDSERAIAGMSRYPLPDHELPA